MRPVLVPAALALLVVSACGSGGGKTTSDSLSPAAAVRTAVAHTESGSSKLDLSIVTRTGGTDVTFTGNGAFAYSGTDVVGSMTLTVGPSTIDERITGGYLYLKVPGQGFYKIKLSDLVGTDLAGSSNPGSSAELLAAIGDSTKKVGTETVAGAKTTHYAGVIKISDAVGQLKTDFARSAVQKLKDSGVTEIPVDVFLDDQSRVRRLVEHVSLSIKGTAATVTTQIDFHDFGTKVDVQVPPADQIKDGSAFLAQLKGAAKGS
jgi:hypothetical protein